MALAARSTGVEGRELYCYNTEGDRNSVASQESCRMDVTRLEQRGIKGIYSYKTNFHVSDQSQTLLCKIYK